MRINRYPDPILNKKARKVVEIDQKLIDFVKLMYQTMRSANGLGLAANQIAQPDYIPAVFVHALRMPSPVINPEITWWSGTTKRGKEKCLSFGDRVATVERSSIIEVTFTTLAGSQDRKRLVGLDAIVFQHETDHLNGITMVDKRWR